MMEKIKKIMNGASSHGSTGFLKPTAVSRGLMSFPKGGASNAPMRIPTSENPTRIAPCLNPSPAKEASSSKARSHIVMRQLRLVWPKKHELFRGQPSCHSLWWLLDHSIVRADCMKTTNRQIRYENSDFAAPLDG